MNYSRWLKDYQELSMKLEQNKELPLAEEEQEEEQQEKLDKADRCLACWFCKCRCAEGLENKRSKL